MMFRWLKKWRFIFTDFYTGLGLFWSVVEMASFMTTSLIDPYVRRPGFAFLILVLIFAIALFKNKPKNSFIRKIRGKDNFIQVKVGDAFSNEGALVVPINNHFDLTLGGNVAKAKSLQKKLIYDFYDGKVEHLKADICKTLTLGSAYKIGTTVEIENRDKRFYLLVNSHKAENNRVTASFEDLLTSLNSVWRFIANNSGRNKYVTVPLINSGHGRDSSLTKMTTVKEIIDSYIEASKKLNVCERLIISIHPDDISSGLVSLDNLEDYLKAKCDHYK